MKLKKFRQECRSGEKKTIKIGKSRKLHEAVSTTSILLIKSLCFINVLV